MFCTPRVFSSHIDLSVCLSVCLSLCNDLEPCKYGLTNGDAVWDMDSGGSKELCVRWGPESRTAYGKEHFRGAKTSGFSGTQPSTVPGGPHAADQRSAEVFECQINFSNEQSPQRGDTVSRQNSLTTYYYYYCYYY